jgi:hypothetical protein
MNKHGLFPFRRLWRNLPCNSSAIEWPLTNEDHDDYNEKVKHNKKKQIRVHTYIHTTHALSPKE